MSDLTELYKFYGEKFPGALKTGQDAQANAIALDNARRAQQERMDLKALYAQQAQPSARKNELELQQALIGMQHQQAQTSDIQRKANEDQAKIRAQATVPIVDRYNEMIASRVPKDQALQWFHSASGQALSKLQQQNLIPPGFSYDPNSISPEMVENAAAGLGFPSQKIQAALKSSQTTAEQQARVGAGPVMTPEQAYGGMEAVPGAPGTYVTQPALGGQTAPQMQMPDEMTAQLNSINSLLQTVQEPTARGALIKARNDLLNTLPPEQSAIATPEQAAELQIAGAAKKEAAVITAKQQAEEQQTINKSLKAYETLPDIKHIRDLVKGSIGSDIEYWTNRLGRTVGESLKAGDFQAALAVVASDMASSVAFAPGSQSDKELAQKLKQVGNLDSNMTPDEKMSAVEEWYQGRQRYIGKYGKYSDDELIALGKEGKITHDTAMKVRANRKKGQ